jgi:hypothetical protein
MSDAFKRTALGLLAFCPEVVQGVKNTRFTASGGTTTTATASTGGGQDNAQLAGAAAGFFLGLFLYFLPNTTTAALRGLVVPITAFSEAAGTATFTTTTTMPASPANGDSFMVFAPLPASSVSPSFGYENLEREAFERQTLDAPSSVKGLKQCSISFNLEMFGLETPLPNGATPARDRLSRFLEALGQRRAVAGTTVSGGSSTTTVVDVTDASAFAVGDLVMIGGEIRRITAIDTGATPDNITVAPALSSAPLDTTVVYQSERFTPYDTGHPSHTILLLRDTQLIQMIGCVFSFGLSGTYGGLTQATIEGDGSDWTIEDTVTLDGAQSTKKALPFVIGETFFGSTGVCVNNFSFELGHGRQALRDTCAGQRQYVTSRDASAQVVFRNTSKTPKDTWEAVGTHDRFLLTVGNVAGAAFALTGVAQIQDPAEMADVEGHQYWDASFAFRDDQTDYTTAHKPEIARF